MNETVLEWLRNAERDFATARREIAVVRDPNYDGVCIVEGVARHAIRPAKNTESAAREV